MLNGEKNLGALFHSVVNQPIQPNQIVNLNDGSSDGTVETAIKCMKNCSNNSLECEIDGHSIYIRTLANAGAVREVFTTRLSQESERQKSPHASKFKWEFHESLAHVHRCGVRLFSGYRPLILYGNLLSRYNLFHGSVFLTAIKDGILTSRT